MAADEQCALPLPRKQPDLRMKRSGHPHGKECVREAGKLRPQFLTAVCHRELVLIGKENIVATPSAHQLSDNQLLIYSEVDRVCSDKGGLIAAFLRDIEQGNSLTHGRTPVSAGRERSAESRPARGAALRDLE